MSNISKIGCSHSYCELNEEELEKESFFEEHFWYFIIPAALILGISIYLEFTTELVLISQLLAIISIGFSIK